MGSPAARSYTPAVSISRPRTLLAHRIASTRRAALADEQGFLHARVALYARILFFFFVAFTLIGLVKYLTLTGERYQELRGKMLPGVWSFAGLTALLGLWSLLIRRHRPPARWVQRLESTGTVLASAAVSTLCLVIPPGLPQTAPFLLVVLALMIRAAIVPSTPWRTLVVGILATAVVSAMLWRGAADLPPAPPSEIQYDSFLWALGAAWGAIFTVATAIVSKVIYGLHQTARDALRLGNYTLDKKIGEGGMGTVYLAHHALLARPTALKLLPPERAGESAVVRFEREVQQTSRLAHPNTVEIYDFGRTPDGIFYYVMEYLDGLTLSELVELEGSQGAGRTIYIVAQVAHALADAHSANLVHRDIKPANVMLCNRGGVADMAKVLDFGLVKDFEAPAEVGVTVANTITGTPLYMAPECVADPELVDARSDLYALGAVGYFLLTGENLFDGGSVVEICAHHLHSTPERPSARAGREIAEDLEDVILRCLAKDPNDRFQSALELRDALLDCRDASTWGPAAASAWWAEHAGEIRSAHAASQLALTPGQAETVQVTLGVQDLESGTGR